jgi:hypothetical protein
MIGMNSNKVVFLSDSTRDATSVFIGTPYDVVTTAGASDDKLFSPVSLLELEPKWKKKKDKKYWESKFKRMRK